MKIYILRRTGRKFGRNGMKQYVKLFVWNKFHAFRAYSLFPEEIKRYQGFDFQKRPNE